MFRLRYLLLGLIAVLLVGTLGVWLLLKSDAAWTWGGHELVDFARSRIYGDIEVQQVHGSHLTGLTFQGVTVTGRQGEVIRAKRVELRFSLWSFVKLQPVIARLAIIEPRLTLSEDREGRWNVSNFFRPKPPPPFDTIDLPGVLVQGGEISLTRGGVTQVFRNLDLQLILTILHPKRPNQAILVRRAGLTGETPWGRLGLQTRFTYGSDLLNILSLSLERDNRPLAALAGEVRFGKAEPTGKILGEIGPVPAAEIRRYWGQWPAVWDLKGKLQLSGALSNLQISGEGDLPQGGYAFHGQLQHSRAEWEYNLALNLTGVQPGAWAARLKGLSPLTASLTLKGAGLPWPPRNLECALQCKPFTYRTAKVEQLHLALRGDPRVQRLQGVLRGNFGRIGVEMAGPLLASSSGEVKLQAQEFQPGLWGLRVEPGSQISGKFAGNFRLPHSLAGDLEATGKWGKQPLKNLKARLSFNSPRLEVGRAQVQLGSLTADFHGALDTRGVDLQGKVSLAMDGSWPLLPAGLRGRVSGEGAVKGAFASPQFQLQAQGQGLAWANFAWAKVNLKASGAGWPPAAGRVEILGTGLKTPAGVFAQAALHGQGEGGRWQIRSSASSPQGLNAELQGAADFSSRPRTITLTHCRFRNPKIELANAGPVRLSFSPGLEMAPATFKVHNGRLTVQARTAGEGLTARLDAVDLPAGLFSQKETPLAGKIQGGFDLSGSLQHPALQGQLTWVQGKWGGFSFRSLHTSVTYREETLALKGSVEEKPDGPRLVWDGRIPVRLSFSPFRWGWGDRDMDFKVQGERTNLALLTALTPEIQKAAGAVSIMAQWQGNPTHPRVSGQVRWGEGLLQFRLAGKPFRLHPGAATLQGGKLVLPDLTLESGGTAHIRGAITLTAFFPQNIDARAELQDFQALGRGGSEATGTGALTLSGPWSAPLLKGRLLVTKATFRPTFFQGGGINPDIVLVKAPPPSAAKNSLASDLSLWKNLKMDLVLDAPGGGAWIKDKRLKVDLAGSLKVLKQPGGKIYLGGGFHSLKGTYELQGHPFKIERGEIRFPGKPGGEITMEGRATHDFSGITMILTASGPVKKPQVKMESIPPLPPADQLAYLVFGRPTQTLSKEEYASQQALGLVGGITAQKIQEFLGSDFPLVGNVSLKSGQQEGRQFVGIVKPLTKNITVTLERKTSPLYRDDTNQVRLEYKYNKYLSVESQMGRRNTGADVIFNLDF